MAKHQQMDFVIDAVVATMVHRAAKGSALDVGYANPLRVLIADIQKGCARECKS